MDGSYEFTPVANWNGYVPTIDYKLVDDSGNPDNFDPSTLDIVVTPVNDTPIAKDDTGTAPYGTPVVVDVLDNDTDPDGEDDLDPSSVQLIDPNNPDTPVKELDVPGEGTWQVNEDGTVTFTPDDGFEGKPTPVDYIVADKDGEPSQPATRSYHWRAR